MRFLTKLIVVLWYNACLCITTLFVFLGLSLWLKENCKKKEKSLNQNLELLRDVDVTNGRERLQRWNMSCSSCNNQQQILENTWKIMT